MNNVRKINSLLRNVTLFVSSFAFVVPMAQGSETTIEVGTTYSDAGAKAYDAYDGDLTAAIKTNAMVDTSVVGNYSVVYTVTDAAGNESSAVRTVRVVDTKAPEITLKGDANVSLAVGDEYAEAGATARDAYDGDITQQIVVSGKVDTTVAGTYVVSYSVKDSSDNEATATRTVVVEGADVFTLASPLHGSVVYVPTKDSVFPLTLTASAAQTVKSVTYLVDGQEAGQATEAPFTVVADVEMSWFGFGAHEVEAKAILAETGEEVVAKSTFTVDLSAETDDVNVDAIPDNPFAVLAIDGDQWTAQDVVLGNGGVASTALVRFEGATAENLQDAPVVLVLDGRVRVSVPRNVLTAQESGIVMATLTEEVGTLLHGADDIVLPEGYTTVENGYFVQVSVLATENGGTSYVELDEARFATNPVNVFMQELGAEATASINASTYEEQAWNLLSHPTTVDNYEATLAAGEWTTVDAQQSYGIVSANLTDLSTVIFVAQTVENEEPQVLIGDVNMDGVIEDFDITLTYYIVYWGESRLNSYLSSRNMNTVDARLADINQDGKVQTWDATLLRYALKADWGLDRLNDYLSNNGMDLAYVGEPLS